MALTKNSAQFLRSIVVFRSLVCLHDMFSLLDHSTRLEELRLCCTDTVPWDTSDVPKTVKLPSLQVVELSGDPERIRLFAERLAIPPSCFVCTEITYSARGREYLDVLAAESRLHRTLSPASTRMRGIRYNRRGFQAFEGPLCRPVFPDADTHSLERAHLGVEEGAATILIVVAASYLTLPWTTVRLAMPVHTLYVDWTWLPHSADAEPEDHMRSLAAALRRGFVPELRTLVVRGIDRLFVWRDHRAEYCEPYIPDLLTILGELPRVLRKRLVKNGGVFQKLVLIDAARVPDGRIKEWCDTWVPIERSYSECEPVARSLEQHCDKMGWNSEVRMHEPA